jgi:hypothetical protein
MRPAVFLAIFGISLSVITMGCVGKRSVPVPSTDVVEQIINDVEQTISWQNKQVKSLLLLSDKPNITNASDADRLLQWWTAHDSQALEIFTLARSRWLDQETIELFIYPSEQDSQVVVFRAVHSPDLFVWLQFNDGGILQRAGHLIEAPAAVQVKPSSQLAVGQRWSINCWRLLSQSKNALNLLIAAAEKPASIPTAWRKTAEGWMCKLPSTKPSDLFGVQGYLYQAQLSETGVLLNVEVIYYIQ